MCGLYCAEPVRHWYASNLAKSTSSTASITKSVRSSLGIHYCNPFQGEGQLPEQSSYRKGEGIRENHIVRLLDAVQLLNTRHFGSSVQGTIDQDAIDFMLDPIVRVPLDKHTTCNGPWGLGPALKIGRDAPPVEILA